MAKAVAFLANDESPLCEVVRFTIAMACPLALIFAGQILPF